MKMSMPPNETIGGACEVVGSLHPHSIIGGIRDVVEAIDSPKDNGVADAYARYTQIVTTDNFCPTVDGNY
jgi:hypothetical protein